MAVVYGRCGENEDHVWKEVTGSIAVIPYGIMEFVRYHKCDGCGSMIRLDSEVTEKGREVLEKIRKGTYFDDK